MTQTDLLIEKSFLHYFNLVSLVLGYKCTNPLTLRDVRASVRRKPSADTMTYCVTQPAPGEHAFVSDRTATATHAHLEIECTIAWNLNNFKKVKLVAFLFHLGTPFSFL